MTHNLNEARRIADRICILHEGKSLQTGSPEELMTRPLNTEVARLIGHDNIFSATVCDQNPDAGKTFFRWEDYVFDTACRPEFSINEKIDWVIPSSHVYLFRPSRPQSDKRVNIIEGKIIEYIQLGEGSYVSFAPDKTSQILHMNISSHVARRDGLGPGSSIKISLLPDYIHLMKKH